MYIYEFKDYFFCVIWGVGLLFMFVLVLVGAFLSLNIVRFLLAKFDSLLNICLVFFLLSVLLGLVK